MVGVAIRFVYVLTTRRVAPQGGDAETYYRLGQGLAAGEGYIRPLELGVFGQRVPTAEFPPFWPTVLAVFDVLGVDSRTGQRLMGALLAASAIVLIGLLGRAVGGPAVGAVAAWISAVYPHFVVYEQLVFPLFVVTSSVFIFVTIALVQKAWLLSPLG